MADKPKSKRFAMPRIADFIAELSRRPGPMAVAGRETAETLARVTEEQVEQRRRNADDADAWRSAEADGLILRRLPVGDIDITALPRDRLDLSSVAAADEMDELKTSIQAHGQREPIEVWRNGEGGYSLKSGWRRLEALRQLHAETGEDRFASVVARVTGDNGDRANHYIAMVEENAIRVDISFAEMANVALELVSDPATDVSSDDEAVRLLYGSLQKTKRSNIRRFVELMRELGDLLVEPQSIPKNLGADVARAIMASDELRAQLRSQLNGAQSGPDQISIMSAALKAPKKPEQAKPERASGPSVLRFNKFGLKVSAEGSEVIIRNTRDLPITDRIKLEAAISAFYRAFSD